MNFTRLEKEKNIPRFNTNLLKILPFRNARSIVATTGCIGMDNQIAMLEVLKKLQLVEDNSTLTDIILYAQQESSQISIGVTIFFTDGCESNLSMERSNDPVEPNYTCNKYMVHGDKRVVMDHSNLCMGIEVEDYDMSEAFSKILECLVKHGEPLDANISPIIR